MAMLVHLSSLLVGFIGPLIIWLIKKDESPFVDRHGRTALNFSITMMIAIIVSAMLILVIIGLLLLPAVIIVAFVFPIIAAVKANKGEEYKYPIAIPFFG